MPFVLACDLSIIFRGPYKVGEENRRRKGGGVDWEGGVCVCVGGGGYSALYGPPGSGLAL